MTRVGIKEYVDAVRGRYLRGSKKENCDPPPEMVPLRELESRAFAPGSVSRGQVTIPVVACTSVTCEATMNDGQSNDCRTDDEIPSEG